MELAKKKTAKKNKTKPERQELRLKKAREWLQTYSGNHLVRDYRKQFKVDPTRTLMDLRELESIDEEKYLQMMSAEEKRKAGLQKKKAKRQGIDSDDLFPCSDDRFFFIAGYTSGGAPYGVTWEEMGLNPYENPDDESE